MKTDIRVEELRRQIKAYQVSNRTTKEMSSKERERLAKKFREAKASLT